MTNPRATRGFVRGAVLLLLACGLRPACAFDVGLAVVTAHEHVAEYRADGTIVVRESGGAERLRLVAEGMPESTGLGWYLRGALGRSSLNYQGQTQLGAPFATTTEYRTREAALGAQFAFKDLPSISLGVVAEERDRTILGRGQVQPLDERYRLRWAELGGRRELAGVEIAASVLRLVDYRQTVTSPGIIDPTQLNRVHGRGYTVSIASARPGWFGMAGLSGMPGLRIGVELADRRTTRSETVPYYRNGIRQTSLAQPEMRRASVGAWIEAGF